MLANQKEGPVTASIFAVAMLLLSGQALCTYFIILSCTITWVCLWELPRT